MNLTTHGIFRRLFMGQEQLKGVEDPSVNPIDNEEF